MLSFLHPSIQLIVLNQHKSCPLFQNNSVAQSMIVNNQEKTKINGTLYSKYSLQQLTLLYSFSVHFFFFAEFKIHLCPNNSCQSLFLYIRNVDAVRAH